MGQNNGMVLIITDDPAVEVAGEVYSSGSVNLFWMELLKLFPKGVLSMPLRKQTSNNSFRHLLLRATQVTISGRRFYHYKWDALKNPITLVANLISLCRDILKTDIVFYRLPSVFLPALLPLLLILRIRKKIVLYIVGDFYARNSVTRTSRIRGSIAAFYNVFERKAAKSFRTFAVGEELRRKYDAEPFDISLIRRKNIAKAQKKFNAKKPRLLYVGNLDANKGLDLVLKALSELKPSLREKIRFTVVGSGPERERLELDASRFSLDDMVTFAGAVPFESIGRFFNEADVFILASHTEGVPKVLYEAMAYRVVIIATDVGGVPFVTDQAKCAYLVPPGSPADIGKALTRVLSDAKLRSRLVKNGHKKIMVNTMEAKLAFLEQALKS